jgi:hypothetical protein
MGHDPEKPVPLWTNGYRSAAMLLGQPPGIGLRLAGNSQIVVSRMFAGQQVAHTAPYQVHPFLDRKQPGRLKERLNAGYVFSDRYQNDPLFACPKPVSEYGLRRLAQGACNVL